MFVPKLESCAFEHSISIRDQLVQQLKVKMNNVVELNTH